MNRRDFLALAAAPAAAGSRSPLGLTTDCFPSGRRPKTALGYLEFCRQHGASGAQCPLDATDAETLRTLRRRLEEWGMYLVVAAPLLRDDAAAFENTVRAAKEAGALCLRSVCLSGRRYETFASLGEWQRFANESRERLSRAIPILEKHKVVMGLENHKDWTLEEHTALLARFDSEYLGVCLDLGNNIALLDDPREVVEHLAPRAVAVHLKDVAVAEYAEGFLLVEVPLGEGILDIPWMMETLRRHRPGIRFTLEMLTRSPLRIPCLTEKYWATYTERHARYLARTLRMVRENKPRRPLPQVDGMEPEARSRLEAENVRKCLEWVRTRRLLPEPA